MEYKILVCTITGTKGLEKDVNAAIKEGWRPLGGVSVAGAAYVTQAMVRDNGLL